MTLRDRDGDASIRRELSAGEQLLWAGRPRQGVRVTFEEQDGAQFAVTGFFLLLLVMVAGITLDSLWDVEGRFNLGALIVGSVFFDFGSVLLALAVGGDAVNRKHTFYGLTDRRIIIITGLPRSTVRSFPLHELQCIEVEVQDDGSGAITFEGASFTWMGLSVVPWFTKIENVQSIHDLILRAKEQPHEASKDAR